MKLDKDKTLEEQGYIININGNYNKKGERRTYYYHEHCEMCNDPFISTRKNGKFCCIKCSGKRGLTDKKHSKETLEKMSKSQSGEKNAMYGRFDEKSPTWKGGYHKRGIPFYDTYAPQLEWCEEVRRNKEDPNILEVRCFKCRKWFIPKAYIVKNRIQYLKGNYEGKGEGNFYCSDECRNSCSIFGKSPETLIKEDAVRAGRLHWLELKREVQPELRKMVIERNGYVCQRCGAIKNLECHHIYPVATNPLESADIDNCIMYCKECHLKAHEKEGCRMQDLIGNIC